MARSSASTTIKEEPGASATNEGSRQERTSDRSAGSCSSSASTSRRKQDRSDRARMGRPANRGAYSTREVRERSSKLNHHRADGTHEVDELHSGPAATGKSSEEKSFYGGRRGQPSQPRKSSDGHRSTSRKDRPERTSRGKSESDRNRRPDAAPSETPSSPVSPEEILQLSEIVEQMRVNVEGQRHASARQQARRKQPRSERGKKHGREQGSQNIEPKWSSFEGQARQDIYGELFSSDQSETTITVSRGEEVASAAVGHVSDRCSRSRRGDHLPRTFRHERDKHREGRLDDREVPRQERLSWRKPYTDDRRSLKEVCLDNEEQCLGRGEAAAGICDESQPKPTEKQQGRLADHWRELKPREKDLEGGDRWDREYRNFSRRHGRGPWRGRQEPIKVGTARADELLEQLVAGTCECMVCCDVIRKDKQVWSCSKCYHIFHLHCIQRWARSDAAQAQAEGVSETSGGTVSSPGWRCPGCQNLSDHIPNCYMCFCGNVDLSTIRRRQRDYSITPHSCGEICNKKREAEHCKHRCNILCHPGPCPPCPVMLQQSCGCGRKTVTLRCSQAATAPSCGETCDHLLACSRHRCQSTCHSGPCDGCEEKIEQMCFCGRERKELVCGSLPAGQDSSLQRGAFSCESLCGKPLSCGNHICERLCHAGSCGACERRPEAVDCCHCGKKSIEQLIESGVEEARRQSCLDPIPSCGQVCNRPLTCGQVEEGEPHRCHAICHDGPCRPCPSKTKKKCRCGRTVKKVRCRDICDGQEILCDTLCNKKRTCGRHRCSQRCCADKEHVCMLVCGKKLQCGYHKCDELCHAGHCGQCWQTGFEELSCYCGAEVIFPPIPCGTRPPSCRRPCSRRHPCEHPPNHTCHNDETCPPCTALTSKMCVGGHEIRNSIPCHQNDISCGKPCGREMPCGIHTCSKICHKGACLPAGLPCQQPCSEPRQECAHTCAAPCHVGQPCPNTLCRQTVLLKCPCGRRLDKVPCYQVNGKMPTLHRMMSDELARKMMGLQCGQVVDLTCRGAKQLECDEVCITLQRNKQMAEALELDGAPFAPDYGVLYSDYLIDKARTDLEKVTEVEDKLLTLVKATLKMPPNKSKSYMFPAMGREQRRLIHELAEHYACETQSYDPEPQRSVCVTATSNSFPPPMSLTNFTKLQQQQRKPAKPPGPVMHLAPPPSQKPMQSLTPHATAKIDYFDSFDG